MLKIFLITDLLLTEPTEAGPAHIYTVKDDRRIINLKHNKQQQSNHDYETSHYWSCPPAGRNFTSFGIITLENVSPPGLSWHSL